MTRQLSSVLAVAAAAALLTPSAATATPPADPADPAAAPGSLVSVESLASLDRAGASASLRRGGWGHVRVRHGVEAHRLTYVTTGVDGSPTLATGVLALPRGGSGDLTTVSYLHGTSTYRPEVASSWRDDYTTGPAVLLAGSGLAAVLPDYLGLGGSDVPHPWMHVATETSASVDMLTAARRAAATLGHTLRPRTHTIGFSQGASVALATTRALQAGGVDGVTAGRTYAISGAYDLAGSEVPALLAGRVDRRYAAAYTALLLVSWDRIRSLYDRPAEVFRRPYASRVERLLDGSTPGPRMLAQLPTGVDALLTRAGLRLLRHPTPALRAGLAQADGVCRWSPDGHVTLAHAVDDEQAVSANTDACARRLRARGADPRVVDLGRPELFGSRHLGTNVAGTRAAVRRLAGSEGRSR